MTQSFQYRPRSLRDIAVRQNQTREETDKAPAVEPEALCTRCQHPRWAHCSVRRSRETCEVLFYARCRGAYQWVRAHAYSRLLSGYSLATCKHFTEGQADFPLCSSSSCAVASCVGCKSYQSPYRKARAKKQATAPKRQKREKMTAQCELFEGAL